MNAVTLKKLEKLKSTYKDGLEDLLSDVSNKKARVPIETNRLFDMKKMLLGEVLMTDRLLSGLEMALKKLLRCRVVIELSDDEDDSDVVMEDGQGTNQPNLDDTAVSKSVQEIVKDYPPKVPMSKNIQLIGEYSSMIQKEQFLEHTEEIVNPISEPSELENTKPINSNKISPAYVLKMTKLRPASSYAKPSNNEARNIVTVPYKPTVKLPCKVLKPVKKLNMITNAKVYEKPFDPKDEAIALKHIKEKIYQKSYLKTNENEQIVLKPTEVFAEPSDAETVEPPPKKKSKARRNTIAVRPPKVVVPKVPKEKSPKNAVVPKVPKKKVNQRRKSVAARRDVSDEGENLDSTEEFKVDEAMEMCKNPVPNHSYKELYTQDWLASKMNNGAEESSVSVPMVEIPKRIFDPLDPEGLMEHIETVPIPPKRGRGRPRKTPKFIPTVQVKEEPV